jgi:hypothetical protein
MTEYEVSEEYWRRIRGDRKARPARAQRGCLTTAYLIDERSTCLHIAATAAAGLGTALRVARHLLRAALTSTPGELPAHSSTRALDSLSSPTTRSAASALTTTTESGTAGAVSDTTDAM